MRRRKLEERKFPIGKKRVRAEGMTRVDGRFCSATRAIERNKLVENVKTVAF